MRPKPHRFLLTAASFALTLGSAAAAIKYSSGASVWDTSTQNWGTVSGGPYSSAWAGFDEAVFEGTGSAVTVASGTAANRMTFNANGYTLTGGTIGLGGPSGGPTITMASGVSATISSTFTNPYNKRLTLYGGGTLNLNGTANAFSEFGLLLQGTSGCTLQISGGTTNSTYVWAGNTSGTNGTLNVSGGVLTIATDTIIGVAGTGGFTISGGQLTSPLLSLGYNAGITGTANLDGGTLSVGQIRKLNGSGTFNFNGGKLEASASSTTYMQGLNAANVKAGGAVIDTNNNNITIAQAFLADSATGGLTKQGAGTLTLTGASTYTGNTTINSGTLAFSGSGSVASSPVIEVGPGTTLEGGSFGTGQTVRGTGTLNGTMVITSGGTLSPAGTGSGSMAVTGTLQLGGTLTMQFNKSGSVFTGDQLIGGGAVTLGGTLEVSVSGDALANGDVIPVLSNTGGLGGTFTSFSLPTLPSGLGWDYSQLAVDGTLRVNNSLAAPVFNPPAGGYVGALPVTITADSGSTIYYTVDGSNPTVSSPSQASPASGIVIPVDSTVTVNAFAKKSGLTDSPIGSATYTILSSARWNVDDNGNWSESAKWLDGAIPDAVGANVDFFTVAQSYDTTVTLDGNRTAGDLTFGNTNGFNWNINSSGGMLTLAGTTTPAIAVNDAITATLSAPLAGSQGITKTGDGTLVLSGANSYSGVTSVNAGTLRLGASNVLADASAVVIASGTTLDMGGRADTLAYLSGSGTVTNNGGLTLDLGGVSNQSFTGSIIGTPGNLTVRGALGGTGKQILNLSAASTLSSLTLTGGGAASLELAGGTLAVQGVVNISGTSGSTPATLTVSGGTFTFDTYMMMGQTADGANTTSVFNQTGGNVGLPTKEIFLANFGGVTEMNLSGGVLEASVLSGGVRADSTINLGGTAQVTVGTLQMLYSDGITGSGKTSTLNLNGGTLAVNSIAQGTALSTSIVNLNGGTLTARQNSAAFLTASTVNVKTGGAIINSNGFDITVAQPLLNDSATGGLTKQGAGTLTLSGANSYAGATAIDGGVLWVNGSTPAASAITVAASAALGGSGTAAGTVSAAGAIEPGTGTTGNLTTGAAILTGTYACQIDGAAADRWNVTGDLDLTGSTLAVSSINPASFTSTVIATYTGTRTGSFTVSPALPTGMTLVYDDTAKEIRLNTATDYASWLSGFTFAPGADTTPGGDADGDGLTNQQEYAFGLLPNNGASVNPITVPLNKSAGSFTYIRRKPSITGLVYKVLTSVDLSTWNEDAGAIQTPTDAGDSQSVVVTLSATAPLAAPKLFVRVAAVDSN